MDEDICFKLKKVSLFTEQILVFFDIPIFFICLGSDHKRYTVLCTDSEKSTYIIIESNTQDILDMLQSKIKMKDLFYKEKTCYFVEAGEDYSLDIVKEKSTDLLTPSDLPEKDAYFELRTPMIADYIKRLSNEIPWTYHYTLKEAPRLFIPLRQTPDTVIFTNSIKSMRDYTHTFYINEKNDIRILETYKQSMRFIGENYIQPSDYNTKVGVSCLTKRN